MAAADRLADLSDGLLVSIISFLPVKDAACTSALSRRWRPLWLRTDTRNLDSRSYGSGLSDLHYTRYAYRGLDAFELKDRLFSDAVAALRAAGRRRVRKLSLFVKGPNDAYCHGVMSVSISMHRWARSDDTYDLLAALLALEELQRIEELHLGLFKLPRPRDGGGSATTVLLPRLAVLRLRKCSSPMKDLEDFIRAAPSLRSLHIHGQDFYSYPDTNGDSFRLHCPSVAAVSLGLGLWTIKAIELDTPCLRNFKYDGVLVDFSMKSPAPELAQVELAITRMPCRYNETEKPWFGAFWRIIRNFQHAKILKLKVPNIHGIADLQIRIANQNFNRGVTEDEALPDFDVSMDLFERRYTKEITAMINGDASHSLDVPEIPELSGCEFNCLRNHLKNAKLEFEFKEMNSFEVSLAKFLAENCMAAAVVQIVDGNRNYLSHINWIVEKWRANAAQQRKHTLEHDSAEL
ncbi:putative FBD-associated F-box protein [Hordeum vulgare]|nr:putative FBD-associated F-box protein [Hordeum vulgare]